MNSSSTPVTATQAMRGMLELIRHTPSVAGLTPEAMGEQLGLPITKASADNYGYAQPLSDGWAFSIQRKQIANEGPRVDLIFAPRGEERLSPRSICEPDFAEFTRELENMGFTRHTGRGAHGRWTHDAFDRDGQQVRVYPVRDIDEKGAVTRTCVEMVLVR